MSEETGTQSVHQIRLIRDGLVMMLCVGILTSWLPYIVTEIAVEATGGIIFLLWLLQKVSQLLA